MAAAEAGWTWFGPKRSRPRPNFATAALALIFALQTFLDVPKQYPLYMVLLAVGACGWLTYMALQQRVLFGLVFPALALFWLNPLLGSAWFSSMNLIFFLGHSVIALCFATAAYTYLATERE